MGYVFGRTFLTHTIDKNCVLIAPLFSVSPKSQGFGRLSLKQLIFQETQRGFVSLVLISLSHTGIFCKRQYVCVCVSSKDNSISREISNVNEEIKSSHFAHINLKLIPGMFDRFILSTYPTKEEHTGQGDM